MRCIVDVNSGALEGGTGRYEKRLSELAGIYADGAAFAALLDDSGDRVVYAVEDLRPSAAAGDLIFGVTRMAPGKVGRYSVTRGHIHAVANRPEIYYGESGAGLMLLELPDGKIETVPDRRADGLLRAALLDLPVGEYQQRRSGHDLRLSRRCRSGLRHHRPLGRHAPAHRR